MNAFEKYLVKLTRFYQDIPPEKIIEHLPSIYRKVNMTDFEKWLVHYTRAHPEMTVDEIIAEAPGYYKRWLIVETESQNMKKAIAAIHQVASQHESTWKE